VLWSLACSVAASASVSPDLAAQFNSIEALAHVVKNFNFYATEMSKLPAGFAAASHVSMPSAAPAASGYLEEPFPAAPSEPSLNCSNRVMCCFAAIGMIEPPKPDLQAAITHIQDLPLPGGDTLGNSRVLFCDFYYIIYGSPQTSWSCPRPRTRQLCLTGTVCQK
jgi:hypothetical protein